MNRRRIVYGLAIFGAIGPAHTLIEGLKKWRALAIPEAPVRQEIVLGCRSGFSSPLRFRDAWDSQVRASGLSFEILMKLQAKGAFVTESRELLTPTQLKIVRTWNNRKDFQTWDRSPERRRLDDFLAAHPEFFRVAEVIS